jgi:hypothetical protein
MRGRRTTKTAVALAVVCLAARSAAASQGWAPDHVVFPTGEWPADVHNVQAAMNQGGSVLLKSTDAAGRPTAFDFGPSDSSGGFVTVTEDVALWGETVRGHGTTIQGGFLPVRSLAPVKSAIRGIRFSRSGFVAINVGVTAGIEITGNTITDMVAESEIGEAIAIFISNLSNPDRIGGQVLIAGNVIAVDERRQATFADGIVILGASGTVKITGNRITDAPNAGISLLRTRRVSIVDNLVVPGQGDPSVVFGNGISLTSPLDGHEVLIADNVVLCDNPNADGILVGGLSAPVSGAVVRKNHVTMHGSEFGAISLYGAVSDALVKGNKISGGGAFALQLSQGFDPEDTISSTRLQGNNLSHFHSTRADVFFDVNTVDNVLAGHCDSVLDLGTNNRYTCSGKN